MTASTTSAPTKAEQRDFATVSQLFNNITEGAITIKLPDGRTRVYGGGSVEDGMSATMTINRWSFFSQLISGGSIGVGESYMDGSWDADDLVAVIRIVIANRDQLAKFNLSTLVNVIGAKLYHASRSNTLMGSKQNIREHYDLSNDLYKLFLDETMTYSSALFTHPEQTLADAQTAKYAALAHKARITKDCHVLEVGCGWGGFAEYAASTIGCKVTGITLSLEQASYARQRMIDAGLDDKVDIQVIDYREVTGTFDRIVSIEMLEAVGHKFLPVYFQKLEELLASDGLAAIQVITLPEQRYGKYLRRPDFIQKHIFPGGHLPSLEVMCETMGKESDLYVEHVENLNMSYAETLRRWRLRFLANVDEVRDLGFDDTFIRMWEFYLAYCEGAFRARYINDLQLVFTRPMNPTLGADPYGALAEADIIQLPVAPTHQEPVKTVA